MKSHKKYQNESFAIATLRIIDYVSFKSRIFLGRNLEEQKLRQSTMKFLDDNFLVFFSSWLIKMNSDLYRSIEKFMLECHQHGLIVFFGSKNALKPLEAVVDGPKVLTVKMLSAGFVLWLICVLVSCVAFISEHIVRVFEMRTKKNRLKLMRANRKVFDETKSQIYTSPKIDLMSNTWLARRLSADKFHE